MIKTNDLMLGNWVQPLLAGGKKAIPMRVVGIFGNTVHLDFDGNEGDPWEYEEKDLLGIPLTEELFEELGYKKDVDYWTIEENITLRQESVTLSMYLGLWFVKLFGIGRAPVVYLHELQNAYYLLTKQHLNFEL